MTGVLMGRLMAMQSTGLLVTAESTGVKITQISKLVAVVLLTSTSGKVSCHEHLHCPNVLTNSTWNLSYNLTSACIGLNSPYQSLFICKVVLLILRVLLYYSESKYSVESVSGKYLVNGW